MTIDTDKTEDVTTEPATDGRVDDVEIVEPTADEPGAEIEVRRPTEPARTLLPTPSEWCAILEMAETLARANVLPAQLRGRVNDVAAILLYGRDVGVTSSVAINRIWILDGKPSMSAELMSGQIRKAGHVLETYCTVCGEPGSDKKARKRCPAGIVEHGMITVDRGALVYGERRDTGAAQFVRWNLDKARRADLVALDQQGALLPPKREKRGDKWVSVGTKDNWWHYTETMMWARCVSELGRMLFADVLNGISYTPDEMGARVDEHGEVIDVEAWDVPPSERRDMGGDEPLPERCDGDHDRTAERGVCCKERMRERKDALPDDLRRSLGETWKALLAQGKANKLDQLSEGDRPVIGALIEQVEAAAAKRAGPSADAVAATPETPETATDTPEDEIPDDAPEMNETDPETVEDEDEIGRCARCDTPAYRLAGQAEWRHADSEDLDRDHPVEVETREAAWTSTAAPGAVAPEHATRPRADTADPTVPPQPDADRATELEAEVAALSHTEVVLRLQRAHLSVNGAPKAVRARLLDYLRGEQ